MIGARTEVAQTTIAYSKCKDFLESSIFRENNNDKEVSSAHKDDERAKTRGVDNNTKDASLQQIKNVSCFGSNIGRAHEESLLS